MAAQMLYTGPAVIVVNTMDTLRSSLVTLAVFVFGITITGEWMLPAVYFLRQFGCLPIFSDSGTVNTEKGCCTWISTSLDSLHYSDLLTWWIMCNIFSLLVYFTVGGFLHWQFYVKRRDEPEKWKCQPYKWLPPDLERHGVVVAVTSLVAASTFSAVVAYYIANGGWSTVYYRFDQYSWSWYFLQYPVIFCYQDYLLYLLHRWYHTPWTYKRFHKLHHQYVQPTAFTVTALHPVEILSIQVMLLLPLFTIPTHWTSISVISFYAYFNSILDHSGVDFKAPWWQPWRPDTIFHDNHHQYFHVNFGFNSYYWDKWHGTLRRADRMYKEDIFYGKGKPISEATAQELQDEMAERASENSKAHRHMKVSKLT